MNHDRHVPSVSLVHALTSLIEPVLVVVTGVVIGGMVVAMYLPIFDLIQAVQAA